MREIKKILIANRGEIALRVVKSCMKMGIKTVGIFSEADKDSPLLEYVDEQILIGPAPSNKSYLNQDLIIKVNGDLISKPYINITLKLLERFGVQYKNLNWQTLFI